MINKFARQAIYDFVWMTITPLRGSDAFEMAVKDGQSPVANSLRKFRDHTERWDPVDPWEVHPVYGLNGWLRQVSNEDTRKGYQDWVRYLLNSPQE